MFGYKIGLNNDSIYVAVAKKYFDGPKMDGTVTIECEGVKKLVTAADKASEATFKDWNYTLYYFKWSE